MSGTRRERPQLHRIAMVCARYPPLTGGTEIHVAKTAERLAALGHDVTVITTVLDEANRGASTVAGVNVIRLRAWPRYSDLRLAPRVFHEVRTGRFDLVHVQGYHTFVAPIAMLAALVSRSPYILTFHSGGHSSALRRQIRPLQQWVLRPMLKRARRLVAVSDYESHYFERRLRLDSSRFTTITNGVDDVFFRQPMVTDPCLVTSVGRLEQYKGHHRVMEAFADVYRSNPELRLRIIGRGPYRNELTSLAATLGIVEAVEFADVPYADRERMARLLAESHVIALASSYEAQGIVGLEALAARAHLVTVDGSALEDLGRHPNVTVVPFGSQPELVNGIAAALLRDPVDERVCMATWDITADRIESLYAETLDETVEQRSLELGEPAP